MSRELIKRVGRDVDNAIAARPDYAAIAAFAGAFSGCLSTLNLTRSALPQESRRPWQPPSYPASCWSPARRNFFRARLFPRAVWRHFWGNDFGFWVKRQCVWSLSHADVHIGHRPFHCMRRCFLCRGQARCSLDGFRLRPDTGADQGPSRLWLPSCS
jgi:hypothetical protein